MFKYGFTQHPDVPCPEVAVSVFAPENDENQVEIDSILDTGAVISVIPLNIITLLGEKNFTKGRKTFRGAFDKEKNYDTFYINITFAGVEFECIEVLGSVKK